MGSPDSSISKLFVRIAVDADQTIVGFVPISRILLITLIFQPLDGRSAMLRFALRQTLIALLATTSALAITPAEQRGKAYAQSHCARCHAIDRTGESPLQIAPPFRTLHLRYPVETLAEALAEGIYTGHAEMPAFELSPEQIHDLLSYLKTLE